MNSKTKVSKAGLFITDWAFYKQMLVIALPIAFQNLVSQGVQMMDTLMLGQLGDSQISGVATANQIYFIFGLFLFGLSAGASVLCAQYWGKGDRKAVRRVMAIALRISLSIGLLFFLAVLLMPEALLRIYTNDAEVIACGLGYLKIVSPIYLTTAFSSAYMMLIRAAKNVRISLICNIVTFLLNVFFNWVFIFGRLGAPAMGARGAALGTLIARLGELILIGVYASFIERQIGFRFRDLGRFDRPLLRDFIHYAMPVVANEVLWGLGTSMEIALLGRLGKEVITANAISSNIAQILTVFLFGVADSALVIVGNEIGAGRKEYARSCARTFELLSAVIGVLLSVTILLVRRPALSIFRIGPKSAEYARSFMTVIALVAPAQCYNCTSVVGLFRGGGDTKTGFVIDTAGLWLYAIPLGALLIFAFHLPAVPVFFAMRREEVFKAAAAFFHLRTGRWVRSVTREA